MSETHTAPSTNIEIGLAIPVSERVQIQNVLMVESRLKRAPDHQFDDSGNALRIKTEPLGVEKHDDSISVRISFLVSSVRNGEDESDPALLIEATFVLVYSITSLEGIEDANLNAFAAVNGVYNAWPYWREYLQNTSLRMGLSPIIAPVFRLSGAPARAPGDTDG